MKYVILLLSLIGGVFGCTSEQREQPIPFQGQYVKSDCNNEPLYLDLFEARYNFPVMCVSDKTDTIDLNTNVLSRGALIPTFNMDQHTLDSINKAKRESFWFQRATWDHSDARFSYLDSFSLLLDTSHEVCHSFFNVHISDEKPVRKEFTRFYPLLIKNLSNDTSQILEYSGAEIEILNKANKWESALHDDVMCLTGVVSYWIAPKETVVILVPITSGNYSCTMRVKFGDKYSNTFHGKCNTKP